MREESYGYTVQTKFGLGGFSMTYRPLVEVDVSGHTKTARFKALVDSGTEITVMDKSIAEYLGITSEGKSTGSLSGIEEHPKPGFIAPVNLKIDRFNKTFTFHVLFIENLDKNFDIILGQQDFFLNFIVRFERHEKTFYFRLSPGINEEQ